MRCIKTRMRDGTPPTIPARDNSALNATNQLDAVKKTPYTATTKARCVRSAQSHITMINIYPVSLGMLDLEHDGDGDRE